MDQVWPIGLFYMGYITLVICSRKGPQFLPWKLLLLDTWAFLAEHSSLIWFQASPTQDPSLWNGKTHMELPLSLGWSIRRVALWSMTLGCTLYIPKWTSGVSPATTNPWTTRSIWGTLSIPRTWCWWKGRSWTTALLARCGPAAATWGQYSISPVLTIYMSMYLNYLWSVLRNLRHFLAYISSKKSTLGFSPYGSLLQALRIWSWMRVFLSPLEVKWEDMSQVDLETTGSSRSTVPHLTVDVHLSGPCARQEGEYDWRTWDSRCHVKMQRQGEAATKVFYTHLKWPKAFWPIGKDN